MCDLLPSFDTEKQVRLFCKFNSLFNGENMPGNYAITSDLYNYCVYHVRYSSKLWISALIGHTKLWDIMNFFKSFRVVSCLEDIYGYVILILKHPGIIQLCPLCRRNRFLNYFIYFPSTRYFLTSFNYYFIFLFSLSYTLGVSGRQQGLLRKVVMTMYTNDNIIDIIYGNACRDPETLLHLHYKNVHQFKYHK